MLFNRVVSLSTVLLSFGTWTLASPAPAAVEVMRRDNADILDVFTTLRTSADSILPQIQSVAASGNVTDETVTPLINELTAALDTATSSLASLSPLSRTLKARQSDSDIATLVAGIITDITDTLDSLLEVASGIPDIGILFVGIDSSLAQVLKGLEILLAGVLSLVANLFVFISLVLSTMFTVLMSDTNDSRVLRLCLTNWHLGLR